MKRHLVRALLVVAACVTLADAAAAVEGGSLLYQNSFGLFYDYDPFDLTLNPAFISRIDRWRLFTNLSNYEDENSYLIGTSGRLGRGSAGLFYETDKERLKDESGRSSDLTTDFTASWDPTTLQRVESETERFEDEISRHGFILSYGVDFGSFTLGASYRPSFSSGDTTLTGSIGGAPDYEPDPFRWSRPSFEGNLATGSNHSRLRESTLSEDGKVSESEMESESFEGSADTDDDRQAFEIGSELRFWKKLPVWVRLGFASIDRTVSGSGEYAYSSSRTQSFGPGDTATETESRSSVWSGDPVGSSDAHPFDGTAWSLEVVPRYAVSDRVTLELGLGFQTMQGDVTGRWTQDVSIERSVGHPDAWRRGAWRGSQHISNSFSGDSDADGYSIAPRVYLTYGPVEFALGVDYSHFRDEVTGSQRGDGTLSWSYKGEDAIGDWTYTGTFAAHGERSFEFTTNVVSLPVATRFKVTDKLELRAGAQYVRTDTETKSRTSSRSDEQYVIRDGRGHVIRQGPGTQGSDESESREETNGTTYYRLGAGYQATENLQFDLLFSQSQGGGVDTSVVYASAVLAF